MAILPILYVSLRHETETGWIPACPLLDLKWGCLSDVSVGADSVLPRPCGDGSFLICKAFIV